MTINHVVGGGVVVGHGIETEGIVVVVASVGGVMVVGEEGGVPGEVVQEIDEVVVVEVEVVGEIIVKGVRHHPTAVVTLPTVIHHHTIQG